MPAPARAALLGASALNSLDLLRLGAAHPGIKFTALVAEAAAGEPVAAMYPHLAAARLPDFVVLDHVDWRSIDVAFSALPNGSSQTLIKDILAIAPRTRIIDLAADYRLGDPALFQKWYAAPHVAPDLQRLAAYGLTEHNRDAIRSAPIIACPGGFPTVALLALTPLVAAGAILIEDMIIDAMSGVPSARKVPVPNLSATDSIVPHSLAGYRQIPEVEQELTKAARGRKVLVNMTPHTVPMSRGALVTCHVRLGNAENATELNDILASAYAGEPFVRLAASGEVPATGSVRGSNVALIGAFDDRLPRRATVIGAIDHMVKGGGGQAIQNFNVAFGWSETTGLEAFPLYP